MYKLSLIISFAFAIMAFNQPNKDKSGNSNNNSNSKNTSVTKEKKSSNNNVIFDQKQQGKKSNNGSKSDDGNKSNSRIHKNFDQKDKGNHSVLKKGNENHKSNHDGKHKTKHYEKGHPNFNYVFVNDHGYYSHKNYGQWRSEQARNKHKKYKPKYQHEAIEGFRLINLRNVFLFDETDYKIKLLKKRLAKKREANQITVVQHDTYLNKIEVLEERRAGINININL